MSRIVASTKDVKDSDNLVIQGEQEAEDTPNAVVVGDPKELDITDTVEMTIQLPSAFFGCHHCLRGAHEEGRHAVSV